MVPKLGRSKSFRHNKKEISEPILIASDAVSRDDLIDVRRDLAPHDTPRSHSPPRPKTANGTQTVGSRPPPGSRNTTLLKIKTASRVYDFPTPGTGDVVRGVPAPPPPRPPRIAPAAPEFDPHPGQRVPIGMALGSPDHPPPEWQHMTAQHRNLRVNNRLKVDRPRSISDPSPSQEYFPLDLRHFRPPEVQGKNPHWSPSKQEEHSLPSHGMTTVIEADHSKPKLSRWRSIGGLFTKRPNLPPRPVHGLDRREAFPEETITHGEPKPSRRAGPVRTDKPLPPYRSNTEPVLGDAGSLLTSPGIDSPRIDVSIPKIEMERYSVMFNAVLAKSATNEPEPPLPASSALLSRRKLSKVERLKSVSSSGGYSSSGGLDPVNISPNAVRPQRSATSPSGRSPGYSLFPAPPSAKAKGPSGLRRSATLPTSSSPRLPKQEKSAPPGHQGPEPPFYADQTSTPNPQFVFDPAEDIIWAPPAGFLSSSRLTVSQMSQLSGDPAPVSPITLADTEYEYEFVFEGPGVAVGGDVPALPGSKDPATRQWKAKMDEEEPMWEMVTATGKAVIPGQSDRKAQIVPVLLSPAVAETQNAGESPIDRGEASPAPKSAHLTSDNTVPTAALPTASLLSAPAPLNIIKKPLPTPPGVPASPLLLPATRYMDPTLLRKAPSPPPEPGSTYKAPSHPPARLPPSPPQETYLAAAQNTMGSVESISDASMPKSSLPCPPKPRARPPIPRAKHTLASGTMAASVNGVLNGVGTVNGVAPSEQSKQQYERVKSIILPMHGASTIYGHGLEYHTVPDALQTKTIRVSSPHTSQNSSSGAHPPRTTSRIGKRLTAINKYVREEPEDRLFDSDHDGNSTASSDDDEEEESDEIILPLQPPKTKAATVGVARQLSLTRARSTSKRFGPGAVKAVDAAGAAVQPVKMVAGPGIMSVQMRQIRKRDPTRAQPAVRQGVKVALTPTLVDRADSKSIRGVVEG